MKLFGSVLLALLVAVVSSAKADEYHYVVTDNVVNDISLTADKIYTATNGGIEVFWKDSSKRFENGLPWQIFRRNADGSAIGGLPGNNVRSIVGISLTIDGKKYDGGWWAMGDNWIAENLAKPEGSADFFVSRTPGNLYACDLAIQKGDNVCPGPYTCFKVYAANDDGLSTVDDHARRTMIALPHGVNRIAVDDHGTVWGIFVDGLVFSLDTLGNRTVWRCDGGLTKGVPNNVVVKGDTVVVTAESGFYLKIGLADWKQFSWPMINVGYYTLRHLPIPVAISKGCVIFGAGGEVYAWSNDQPNAWTGLVPGGAHSGFSVVNCLAADDEKLYLGTDNKMWVCEGGSLIGQKFVQKSVTGIRYPHDNVITHINRASDGRILVGGLSGGYRYANSSEGPIFEGSVYNVADGVVASFVDNKGAQWIGRAGYITRNDVPVYLPNLDGGLYPYWLVRGTANDFTDLWMVTSNLMTDPTTVWLCSGSGNWFSPPDAPSQLAKEKVLSVNSTGKRLWIGTDSSLYSYDFHGNWTYKRLHYSSVRVVCGDINQESLVWMADGGYQGGSYDVKCIDVSDPSYSFSGWRWPNRRPNAIVQDSNSFVWVATDSGAYAKIGIAWQGVPVEKLADDFVNTVFVDGINERKSVWFGTNGGLTVWHMPEQATSTAPARTSVRPLFQVVAPSQRCFDILGRSVNVLPNRMMSLPSGLRIIQNGNQAAKRLNIAR